MTNTPAPAPVSTPRLTNRSYDNLKFVAQIVLPALGTLYFVIAGLWHLPAVTETIGTITAIDVFLGALLGLSSSKYAKSDASNDGTLVVTEDPEDPTKAPLYSFEVSTPLSELPEKKSITLKVARP